MALTNLSKEHTDNLLVSLNQNNILAQQIISNKKVSTCYYCQVRNPISSNGIFER